MLDPTKVVSRIEAALAPHQPVALRGPTLALSLEAAVSLWLVPWACNSEARIGFVHTPEGKESEALYATPGDLRQPGRLFDDIRAALEKVGPGSRLEILACAPVEAYADADEEGEPGPAADGTAQGDLQKRLRVAARFRLRGTVGRDGSWTVTHAFPQADGDSLKAALEILGKVEGSDDTWARDASEGQAVLTLADRSSEFLRTNPAQILENRIEVDGAQVRVKPHRRPYVALMLLRHRLGNGPWDLRPAWEADEQLRARLVANLDHMARAMAEAKAKNAAPRIRLLLETPVARYFQTDFSKLPFDGVPLESFVHDRYPDIPATSTLSFASLVERVDADMKGAGLQWLGDFQYDKQPPEQVHRAYGAGSEGAFGLLSCTVGNPLVHWTFYSLLGNDFWVSTATFALMPRAPRPARGSHRASVKASVGGLHALHREHVATHEKEGAMHASPQDLPSLIQLMDAFNASLVTPPPKR